MKRIEKKRRKDAFRPILFYISALAISLTMGAALALADDNISVSGITEPIKDVILGSESVGVIENIFFKEGARIQKGQRILVQERRLEELEAQRRKIIWQSKAELTSALERVKTLKPMLEANRELFAKTRSISKEELLKLELDYKLAVAEKQRLEVVEEREHIEYEMALANLKKRILKSPINGTITELLLDEGEICQEQQPLVHVVDTSRCRFICNIEEQIGRNLKRGQTVDLEIKTGFGSVKKEGKVVFVSPVVDPASGLLVTKVEFENGDGMIRPGVSGSMILNTQQ
ncbi:efflux RND transporter periplasmic adaptor subunit [Thermodesulfobacteriota bacterium]